MGVLQGNKAQEQESGASGCAKGQVERLIPNHKADKRTSEISNCVCSRREGR